VEVRAPQGGKQMKALFRYFLNLFGVKNRKIASPVRRTPRLKMDLQFFAEPGVEGGDIADPALEVPTDTPTEPTDQPIDTPSVDPQDPPTDDLDQSKAFAKRLEERTQKALAEERAKWEQEVSQKYGNYDQYQKSTQFVMQQLGINDFEEFQKAIEDAELAKRAEQNGVNPEYQQRLEQLEEKAKRADELEQQQQQEQIMKQFQTALQDFSKEKGIEATELEQFMVENQIPHFEMAYRAMKYEQMENDLKNAKDVAVKEYLESKKAPKVEGPGTPGLIKEAPPKNFAEARQRALERLNAAEQ
jgi:hypothetical protein